MSHVRLDAMNVEISNTLILDNDIHVHFEYEKLSKQKIKIFLDTYVGRNEELYRFLLRVIYDITLNKDFSNDKEMIEEVIHMITKPLMNLIMMIDDIISCEEERLS